MSAKATTLTRAREAARAAYQGYGGTFVDPPILQPAHTYLELAGEQLRGRLVVVSSNSAGDELCLRPDLTVAAALDMLTTDEPKPGALIYDGAAFRQPPDISDRPTEFPQIGRESFGGNDSIADDAEAIKAALDACRACGVTDMQLAFSDAGLAGFIARATGLTGPDAARAAALLRQPGALADGEPARSALGTALSGLSPKAAEQAVREILAITGADPIGGRSPKDIAERLLARGRPQASVPEAVRAAAADIFKVQDSPASAVAAIEARAKVAGISLAEWGDHWRLRLTALEKGGIDLSRARFNAARDFRFGYYDGFVFELITEKLGLGAPVGVGGRYDGLLSKLSNGRVTLSAVGSMVRVDRLVQVAGGVA